MSHRFHLRTTASSPLCVSERVGRFESAATLITIFMSSSDAQRSEPQLFRVRTWWHKVQGQIFVFFVMVVASGLKACVARPSSRNLPNSSDAHGTRSTLDKN